MKLKSGSQSILIEVAAQHPLSDGREPNAEFASRLDLGRALYVDYASRGWRAEIYVPGSRHKDHGVEDSISLSRAGLEYLCRYGVPSDHIQGENLNLKYKGNEGVYGSADECFVAASYFHDEGFGSLASVLAPAQVPRKTLHYIAFGVFPLCYTAPTHAGYHNIIGELYEAIPHVLEIDRTLQDPSSRESQRLRRERRPTS